MDDKKRYYERETHLGFPPFPYNTGFSLFNPNISDPVCNQNRTQKFRIAVYLKIYDNIKRLI